MDTITQLLTELKALNVKLWIEDDHLCYQAPKGALTPTLKTLLRDHKTEIKDLVHQANSHNRSPHETIQPVECHQHLPLSFAQQRLWFLDKLEPDSPAYNEPWAIQLNGLLNVEALEQSLNEILKRHETLRTTFLIIDGQPIQAITPASYQSLSIIDLQELQSDQRLTEAQLQFATLAQQPFDLSQGPLMLVKLLKLSAEEHWLLFNFHHIICDRWSFGVFNRELTALYTAFISGQPSPLPELPIQYADFAHWQGERLQGSILEDLLTYWKRQLSGQLPVLELPTDHPRPPLQSYRGSSQSLQLSQDLTIALNNLSRQSGATLFMTLLAAFKVLLHRYSGQEDIIVGIPIAGRNRPELENLIGFFLNTLVLRTDLSGNPRFHDLLKQVREIALGAYEHQDLPFEKLVEELQPQREQSISPLFQVMLILQNTPTAEVKLPGLTISSLKNSNQTAKYDLTLYLLETEQGLNCHLEYNTDLFVSTTITRILSHFQTLLEGIVANPNQRLSDLPLLTERERYQLLVEWNDTQTDYPQEQSIQQLFEAQVERTPDALAAIYENQRATYHYQELVTYQELNGRANQLAHYLQKQGVGPEVLVGIYLERSLEMVEALVGILKAGGAYVPLDPDYPAERLAFILSDAQVSVLLTRHSLLEQLPNHSAQVVCLDIDWEDISQESEENPGSLVTAANLAYVIYTSGSTGQPKGVAVPHQQILNRLAWMWDAYPFQAGEVGCSKAAINFVDSIWELLGPLLQGVPTVIIPNSVLQKPFKFVQILAEHQVTRLWVVPSFLRAILDTVPNLQSELPNLKFWVTSGEAISVELLQRFQESLPQAVLYNLYGTSEVWDVTWYEPDPQPQKLDRVPIGRPIANIQAYILDAHRQPVPVGVPGELYVGGVGLARGYINRPELTEKKFITNPFSRGRGAGEDESSHRERLYKTGDLARYLPDGNIEFLGRLDNQVKIRGFRIELGEVEATLSQHSAIEQTVVIARDDISDDISEDKRLVAYLVLSQDQTLTVDELRRFLQKKLPSYMIPSAFVFLDALPLTPNGKIDRHALPAPDQTRLEQQGTFVAPRDELELQLTQIWEKVLGIKAIGIHDNFFDIGGHSLLAIQLFDQIEKIFKKNLSLSALFQGQTVEQLAKILHQEGWSSSWYSLVPIQPNGSKPPLFAIHELGQGFEVYRPLANYLGPEQPIYGLRYGLAAQTANSEEEILPSTVEELAAHYVREIRSLQPEGPYFLAAACMGGLIALEMAQQLHSVGQEMGFLALFDAFGPGGRVLLPIHKRFFSALSAIFRLEPADTLHRLKTGLKRSLLPLKTQPAPQMVYSPQTYSGRVILFRPTQRRVTVRYEIDPQLGWGAVVTGGLEIHDFPVDHFNMLQEPHVQIVAEKLKFYLDTLGANREIAL
jgi:aspartate racemase